MKRKERKSKRIKKEEGSKDLRIFSPTGELIFIGKQSFSVNYQELIRKRSKFDRKRPLIRKVDFDRQS